MLPPRTPSAILNQLACPSRRALVALAAAFSLLGMATALGTAYDTPLYEGPLEETIAAIALPPPTLVHGDAANEGLGRETRIQQGDTVARIFQRLGIDDDGALHSLRRNPQASVLFRQLAPGKTVAARVTPAGELVELVFPLNGEKDAALTIRRNGDDLAISTVSLAIETSVEVKSAVITHSLFGAADDVGMPDAVALQLADIFGGEIDFHRDLRQGDRFAVAYEIIRHQSRLLRSGRILAAEFINDGKRHTAYWFASSAGAGYYDAQGMSLKKAFLRSPLEFSRITSGFSTARYHPILKEMRAHRGIDYAAPIGTRVRATGDGVVEFVGTQGGYGKVVVLRHAGDRSTVYGHLSAFASGLRKGQRVAQGETIGYVGATGLATGPHLHYEFRVGGVHRNPLTAALPAAVPLAQEKLPAFREMVAERSRLLAASEPTRLAAFD